jgi:hypothetical protein
MADTGRARTAFINDAESCEGDEKEVPRDSRIGSEDENEGEGDDSEEEEKKLIADILVGLKQQSRGERIEPTETEGQVDDQDQEAIMHILSIIRPEFPIASTSKGKQRLVAPVSSTTHIPT